MAKSLLVVESPTKMKTLSKFLGSDFNIKATYGHIKDLPKSKIGVDIENGFTPHFLVLKEKSKIVEELKKAGKESERVFIGSDPDREGEAIAFHIAEVIGQKKEIKRVLFHEITKKGVIEAINSPTELDEDKYNAQKARRILDRIVGYMISPLLWEKVSYGLSAGRVQSVALRLICDREEEIEGFIKEEYWVISGEFELPSKERFRAILERKGEEKIKIPSEEEAKRIKSLIDGRTYTISKVETKDRLLSPQPAFITSRLQQEASRRFKFSPKKTMLIAQRLYEGVDVGEGGTTGLITYMRTDSVRVSEEAISGARRYIEESFGKEYLPKSPNIFKNKKSAQDAHEAIRPTDVFLTPEKVKPYLEKDLFLLYELIWKRFIASQMAQEKIKQRVVEVSSPEGYTFVAKGHEVIFDGFTKIYEEQEEKEETIERLPPLKQGERVVLVDINMDQRFTQPPPRYSEATLIKMLEAKGIGRPSTYATIISTIEDRKYVKKEKGRLVPLPLGRTVNRLLKEFFPLIVNVDFTAKMEERLDLIEGGKKNWVKSLERFYQAFEKELTAAKSGMKSLKKEEQETDIICDRCGKTMVLRWGKNGEYLVCSGRPACKNKKNVKVDDQTGKIEIIKGEVRGVCPQCGGELIEKMGRFGRFLACSNYPDCKYTESYNLGFLCPVEGCQGKLVEKVSKKKKKFISCSQYPVCTFATNYEPTEGPCPTCSAPTLFKARRSTFCLRKDCGWKSKS
ncbi:MAG: type I DNA topoisomerase [Syntrophorhabdaceae bacterium]|nr:type I DNA topoisomerase [Syntrophorhabdaceae bacterium]